MPVTNKGISLRPTTASDLDHVLALEQDNAGFVRQWTREQHLAAIDDENIAHLTVHNTSGDTLGYLILIGIKNPDRSIEFKRIVVGRKGDGVGRMAVQHVKRLAFEECGTHRLWLEVMEHNRRAYRLYGSEGFVDEGIHRECLKQGDRFVSLKVMSILAHEYERTA
ncbi:MAG: GNAT family N-acetyltransferase [Planctomycetota bacterium]|jgi:RimJ/RimL family protein N-acetyltransferase